MKTVRYTSVRVTPQRFLAISEAAWTHALTLDDFGYAHISAGIRINVEQASRIVRGWLREGAVELVHHGASGKGQSMFRVVRDFVRPEPTRLRTPEENMWLAFRKHRSFTPTDLAAHSTTETVKVSSADAAEYCRALLAAEYLVIAQKAVPGRNREAIYRLINETGVQPPLVKRVRAVVDANIGATIVIGGGL